MAHIVIDGAEHPEERREAVQSRAVLRVNDISVRRQVERAAPTDAPHALERLHDGGRVLTGQDSLDQAVQRSALRPQRQGNRQATSVEIVGIGVPERNHMRNVGNVAQLLGLETSCGFLEAVADVAEFSP